MYGGIKEMASLVGAWMGVPTVGSQTIAVGNLSMKMKDILAN